jgi:hypothetical protein
VDWPGCTFYGELLEMNPDAKAILTVRDPQRWYKSVRDTIYRTSGANYSVAFRLAGLVTPRARRLIRASRFVSELVWEGDFDGRFGDRGHAIETFERHNEEVKRRVPPGMGQARTPLHRRRARRRRLPGGTRRAAPRPAPTALTRQEQREHHRAQRCSLSPSKPPQTSPKPMRRPLFTVRPRRSVLGSTYAGSCIPVRPRDRSRARSRPLAHCRYMQLATRSDRYAPSRIVGSRGSSWRFVALGALAHQPRHLAGSVHGRGPASLPHSALVTLPWVVGAS